VGIWRGIGRKVEMRSSAGGIGESPGCEIGRLGSARVCVSVGGVQKPHPNPNPLPVRQKRCERRDVTTMAHRRGVGNGLVPPLRAGSSSWPAYLDRDQDIEYIPFMSQLFIAKKRKFNVGLKPL
jgi:hypothetical protein